MGAAGNLSNSCQFDFSVYPNATIFPHSPSGQASLYLRISSTANLADALGLMWDRHCGPRLVGEWRSREAGRFWAAGLPIGKADVENLPTVIVRYDAVEAISERGSAAVAGAGSAISLRAR
jgi:hypothetical protein